MSLFDCPNIEFLPMLEAQRLVRHTFPEAHSWIVLVAPEQWQVQPKFGYKENAIGEGKSELEAWRDAARRVVN
jgi:hypothetical protein